MCIARNSCCCICNRKINSAYHRRYMRKQNGARDVAAPQIQLYPSLAGGGAGATRVWRQAVARSARACVCVARAAHEHMRASGKRPLTFLIDIEFSMRSWGNKHVYIPDSTRSSQLGVLSFAQRNKPKRQQSGMMMTTVKIINLLSFKRLLWYHNIEACSLVSKAWRGVGYFLRLQSSSWRVSKRAALTFVLQVCACHLPSATELLFPVSNIVWHTWQFQSDIINLRNLIISHVSILCYPYQSRDIAST